MRRTFEQRIGFFVPCVGLAEAMLDHSRLRPEQEGQAPPPTLLQEASHNHLCYLRVLRRVQHADLYVAEVAASPEQLRTRPFPVFFTEEQLRATFPWDCRLAALREKNPGLLIVRLRALTKGTRSQEPQEEPLGHELALGPGEAEEAPQTIAGENPPTSQEAAERGNAETCATCGNPLTRPTEQSRARRYCSERCRRRAYRERKASHDVTKLAVTL